jgi:predicted dehydrogenase
VDAAHAQRRLAELAVDAPVYARYEECLAHPGVEAVVIATPNDLHADQVVAAAQAGKAVLVEKPAALTLEELDRVGRAVREAGVVCQVNMILRFHPMFEAALERVRAGELGDVYYVEGEMLYGELEIPEPDWERTASSGRNIQLAVGCHAFDQVLRLAGREPVEVLGVSTRRKESWEFDPVSTVLIRFEGGVLGRVTTNLEAQMPYAFNLRVFGTRGTIVNNAICIPQGSSAEFRPLTDAPVEVEALPFDRSAAAFAETVRGGGLGRAPFEDARRTFELAIAADRACVEGHPIHVSLSPSLS